MLERILKQLITNVFTSITTKLEPNSNGLQMDDSADDPILSKMLIESLKGTSLSDYLHNKGATETKFYRFFSVRDLNDIS